MYFSVSESQSHFKTLTAVLVAVVLLDALQVSTLTPSSHQSGADRIPF